MPKRHLTNSFIRNPKMPNGDPIPENKRVEFYDQHKIENNKLKASGVKGLFIRLTAAGSIYFYYRYYMHGKRKSFKIGSYPDIGLSDARHATKKENGFSGAKELAQMVNNGTDPQAEKNKRKQVTEPKTFKELSTSFIEKYLPTLRPSTQTEYKRIIDVELLPKLAKYPIKDISINQIINLLDAKAYGSNAPVMANRIRARLSTMFTFAIDRRLIDYNPVQAVKKYKKANDGSKVEKKRNRWYRPDELRSLWQWFEQFNEPTRSVYMMLLVCGQRKTETMKMKWDDIENGVWVIPAELAKNKEEHLVPLSDMALSIIEGMKPITGDTDYVFCSPKKENEPISWLTRANRTIKNHSDVSDFRPHDLRRTVATYMAKLSVDRTVLGKILNHKGLAGDSQVTAIYDRHGYMDEKRQAMNRWSYKLNQIIEDKAETKIHKIG